MTVTVPSLAIETKIFGSSRQPLGMPSAPNFFAFCSSVWPSSARARSESEWASTRAPMPPITPRRLKLSMRTGPAAFLEAASSDISLAS